MVRIPQANILTDKEMARLAVLGIAIRKSLECDINKTGVPCHTDRLHAVKLMREYVAIHDS